MLNVASPIQQAIQIAFDFSEVPSVVVEFQAQPELVAQAGEVDAAHAIDFDPSVLSTEEKVARAHAAIDALMDANHPLCLAYSGGKDSTVLTSLVVEVAMARKAQGKSLPTLLVTHARTGIENPAMETVVKSEIARLLAYSDLHGLGIRLDIAEPSLNDSWAVRIIGGRALPTFANSSTRDCSVSWKVIPQARQRKRALKELEASGEPVVMTGTRYEESASRAARMKDRGELDTQVWEEPVRNKAGSLVRVELRMSPIAHWGQDDVWVYLSELLSGERASYTDAADIWEAYKDGGNSSCAVVGDDALKASAKACGARFGCSLCAAVGRDKSLEAMLEADPKYAYMLPLNKLQRFIVDTQYDMSRRLWVGRTIDDEGFIAIAPDAYGPEMQEEMLRYALTIDRDEKREAARLGIEPRFELVSTQQLVAIDAIWSMQGYHKRPFAAVAIWDKIYNQGASFYPPKIDATKFDKVVPKPMWLYVGADYESDPGFDQMYTGTRSMLMDLTGASDTFGCATNVDLGNGNMGLDFGGSKLFTVDAEGAEEFLAWEVVDGRIHERYAKFSPGAGYQHYLTLGTISTSRKHQVEIDRMLRRAAWKERHGVFDMSTEEVLAISVTSAERKSGLKVPAGQLTLQEQLQIELAKQHEARWATLSAADQAYFYANYADKNPAFKAWYEAKQSLAVELLAA